MTADEIRKDSARRYCGALEIAKAEHHELFKIRMLQEIAAQLAEFNSNFSQLAESLITGSVKLK